MNVLLFLVLFEKCLVLWVLFQEECSILSSGLWLGMLIRFYSAHAVYLTLPLTTKVAVNRVFRICN